MSNYHKVARIYRTTKKNDKGEQLKIDNNHIKFLRDILLDEKSSIFKKIDENNWVLTFFNDSEKFAQTLHVNFYEPNSQEILKDSSDYSKKKKLDYKFYDDLCRLVFMQISSTQPNSDETEYASLCVRDSKSIKQENLFEATTHYGHIDGRGLMFLTNYDFNYPHFERHIILLSLAYAYLGAIEMINDKLSKTIILDASKNHEEDLRNIYLDISKFNAKYMFSLPVKNQNTGLVAAWHRISSALKIDTLSNELVSQVETVHNILKIDDEIKKSNQEKMLNSRLTYIGIVISLFGLISVYKDIKELWFPWLP